VNLLAFPPGTLPSQPTLVVSRASIPSLLLTVAPVIVPGGDFLANAAVPVPVTVPPLAATGNSLPLVVDGLTAMAMDDPALVLPAAVISPEGEPLLAGDEGLAIRCKLPEPMLTALALHRVVTPGVREPSVAVPASPGVGLPKVETRRATTIAADADPARPDVVATATVVSVPATLESASPLAPPLAEPRAGPASAQQGPQPKAAPDLPVTTSRGAASTSPQVARPDEGPSSVGAEEPPPEPVVAMRPIADRRPQARPDAVPELRQGTRPDGTLVERAPNPAVPAASLTAGRSKRPEVFTPASPAAKVAPPPVALSPSPPVAAAAPIVQPARPHATLEPDAVQTVSVPVPVPVQTAVENAPLAPVVRATSPDPAPVLPASAAAQPQVASSNVSSPPASDDDAEAIVREHVVGQDTAERAPVPVQPQPLPAPGTPIAAAEVEPRSAVPAAAAAPVVMAAADPKAPAARALPVDPSARRPAAQRADAPVRSTAATPGAPVVARRAPDRAFPVAADQLDRASIDDGSSPAAAAQPARAPDPAQPRVAAAPAQLVNASPVTGMPMVAVDPPRAEIVPPTMSAPIHPATPTAEAEPAAPRVEREAVAASPVPALPVADRAVMPAFRAFATAMFEAAGRDARPAIDPAVSPAAPLAGVAAPLTAPATADVAAPMDLLQPRWPAAMAERIEILRDRADAGDTRIRLIPDALGSIDIAVRQVGDTIHVHFTAAEAQTRAMLIEAQPQLARAAADRGMSLGEASVGGGQGDTPGQRAPQSAPTPHAPRPARPVREDVTDTDTRIA
jgi:Meckel syndrome type 1 protein